MSDKRKKVICMAVLILLSTVAIGIGVNISKVSAKNGVLSTHYEIKMSCTSTAGGSDSAEFGAASNATDGFDDDWDIPQGPPSPEWAVQAYFWYPGNPPNLKKLSWSYVNLTDSMTWPLRIKLDTGDGTANVIVEWNMTDIDKWSDEYTITLETPDGDIDMRTNSNYTYENLSPGNHDYTINATADDIVPPEITNAKAFPSLQKSGGWVNISCNVIDNLAVRSVIVKILYPNGENETVDMINLLETVYYYNATYTAKGEYEYLIQAEDICDNTNNNTGTFTIDDRPPEIMDVEISRGVNNHVNISAVVTDNIDVDTVKANITYPASGINATMTNIPGTDNYYYNTTYLTYGTYNYFIWANDTSRNGNTTSFYSFTNNPPYTPSKPSGWSSGYIDVYYSFSTSAADPDGDKIKYGWDWDGDDSVDEWTVLYDSGSACSISHSWNSAGIYYVKVKAKDDDGHRSRWSPIQTVIIKMPPSENQPPTINITSPSDGETVSGKINITGSASDDESVKNVEVRIDDGSPDDAVGTTSWSYSWNTTTVENGNHSIYARGYDGEDYSPIASVTVKVWNDHPPVVNITFPVNNSKINGTITIAGIATDPDGNETLREVKVKIDEGEWQLADGTTNWTYEWDTTTADNGKHIISVRAWDGEKYSDVASASVIVDNEKDGDGIPGFEMVSLFAVVAIVLLWKRKRQ